MKILASIPLFLILIIAYNAVAFAPSEPLSHEAAPLFSVTLLSGADWTPRTGDLLILLAVLLLYLELFKATRSGIGSIVEHVLSMFVFIAFLVEFLIVERAGTSTFLVLTMLSLLDVIGGFTISISTARRDFGIGESALG